jgi:membrane-bound serine protease (ClpP class)
MRAVFVLITLLGAFWVILCPAFGSQVDVCRIEGVIGPVCSEFIVEAIQQAVADSAVCLVIELDTPGGLDTSMRIIIKELMASEVPVVVYVSPSGSRAASAGVFMTIAAHVAAMAPGTNIGAAHPVALGGGKMDSTMVEKITNDAAAYIRTIAEKRGRNADWAEDAVRNSVSATEKEALELGVIDLVCRDVPALLDSLDGRRVSLPSGERVLQTSEAVVNEISMGLRERVLSAIADPNIAYILMILGIYGIIFEMSHPGAYLPGVVGGICLILAFFAFQTLSVNYAGVLLILFAVILFIAEILTPTYGVLATGGVIAMVLGSTMLFDASVPFLKVSWTVILPAVITTTLFFLFAVGMGLKAQRRRSSTGIPDLIGRVGVARTDIIEKGTVFISGEHWCAVSDEPVRAGERVRVVSIDHLVVKVVKSEV